MDIQSLEKFCKLLIDLLKKKKKVKKKEKSGILKNMVAEVQNRRAFIFMTHWAVRNAVVCWANGRC